MQTAPTKKNRPSKRKKHIFISYYIYWCVLLLLLLYTHIYTYDIYIYIYIFADRIIHVNFINNFKSNISLQIQQDNIHPKEK